MILRREYTPRAYAPLALDFMSSRKRSALWAAPGMGKTSLVYTLIDAYFVSGLLTGPVLVIGPLRVARDTWTDEVLKWDHLRELDTAFIGGTKQQREAALKKDAQVFTTNYEQIPWLVEKLGGRWPFQMVVADESTRLKGFRLQQGTRRAQALSEVAFQSEYWINLTGTPAPNGLLDLWGQTWFLDQGQRLGTSYSAFCERWFYRPPKDGGGPFGGKLKAFKHAEKEIHSALRDVCLTLDPKDWFDLQDPVVTQIKVKLPPDARRIYDEFEDTMFAELADQTELEVFNAAALTNKCLQIANGAVYLGKKPGAEASLEEIDAAKWKGIHDAKIEALKSLVEELNVPPLVAYQFVSDKERILKALPGFVDLSTKTGMAAFKAGDARGGVAHPKSMGHGIDGLQDVTNAIVRFGHDWNLEERMQMLERIGPVRQAQSGHDRPVLVYDIVAEDTIDETVIERHESKREVQDLLLAAMKHHSPMLAA